MRINPSPLILIATTLMACGGQTEVLELDAARTRWDQLSLHTYRFEYTRSCECTLAGEPLLVVVDSGRVSTVSRRDTGEVLAEHGSVPTIPALFETLVRARSSGADWSATYDPTLGYPRTVSIDWTRSIADDESTETISGLNHVTRGAGQ